MTPEERAEFVADGRSGARRRSFRAARAAVSAWERAHPVSFVEYLAFLDGFQAAFGPFPVDERLFCGDDYRL